MKNFLILLIISSLLIVFACNKEEEPERLKFLTSPVWASDSLLVNGTDASGPGELLEKFKGDAKFNRDGTGQFGDYSGTWKFAFNETEIIIFSDSLDFPIATQIVVLTKISLKIVTGFPNPPNEPYHIRMTFNAK